MAIVDVQKSYIGVGKVLARPYGSTGRLRYVGNVSKLGLKQKLDTKKQKDYTRSGGGTLARIDRLDSVEAAMTWLSFSAENWALACAGVMAPVVGGTVAAEVVKGYLDSTVPLANPPSAITTVTNSAATTTYAAGTDYEKSASGIYIPPNSTIIDAADLKVTYTYGAYSRVEGVMQASTVLELLFEGLNEADSNKPVLVNLWRVSVPSADEIALIGDDFGKSDFSSELLKDPNKGTGVSAFYRALLTT
jgi:hypothetical protein